MCKSLLSSAFATFILAGPAHAQFCPGTDGWVFDDVLASDPFCGYITWAAQNGVSLGCQIIDANHRLYCPTSGTTRSQMAAFLNRSFDMPDSTANQVGTITKPGGAFLHNYAFGTFLGVGAGNFTMAVGGGNTGVGRLALHLNESGTQNTAVGDGALFFNTTGSANTAIGSGGTLTDNTTGSFNTAVGASTLLSNTTADMNTAVGAAALNNNITGDSNTALGAVALVLNSTGSRNTAVGTAALNQTTTGSNNSALGTYALYLNATGAANTAMGFNALANNISGNGNAAFGEGALQWSVGTGNTAVGDNALVNLTAGNSNLVLGASAGSSITSGSDNIYLVNSGPSGAESQTIRIGSPSQLRAFVAGIRGITTGANNAVNVVIDSNGQLGTISSSRVAKEDIADMSDASAALMHLRPVTFHYKSDHDAAGPRLQYGLIAEEVAEVYPGLVATKDGKPETVMYQYLAPMLLNEYQKQQRTIERQARELVSARNAQVAQAHEIVELKRAVEVLMARTGGAGLVASSR